MGSKSDALEALEDVIKEFNLKPTMVAREITSDPSFMDRMRDHEKSISTNTLDNVWRFILKKKGQLEMDFGK